MEKPIQITQQNLLLVEGKDEEYFFQAFFRSFEITGIQIFTIEGKDNFSKYLSAISQMPDFAQVKKLGVIRDADTSYENAFKSVRDAVKKCNLLIPLKTNQLEGENPAVGIFIMPGEGKSGALEDLLLESVQNDRATPCVNNYFVCLKENLSNWPPKNISKSWIHAFLSSRPDGTKRLGEAAHAGYWSFDNPAFDEIRHFIDLFKS